MDRIYLDHAATTPILPSVAAEMRPWIEREFGNPSSQYAEGRRARQAIDQARETLSDRLGCLFAEALFTGSGTEAANLAIIGTALAHVGSARNRILVGASEHHCVLNTRETVEALGFRFEEIPVDCEARIDRDRLARMLADDVLLVSVMHANNELGSINPVREIADAAHRVGAMVHSDCVQTFGMSDWRVADLDVDLATVSAHKIGGPKGVGAIYIRAGVKPKPLLVGGGQEREMRGGTENVAGIVGFGEAIRRPPDLTPRAARRDRLEAGLTSAGFVPSVGGGARTAGHVHVRFPGIQAETILIVLDRLGLSASSGAACSSGSIEPSHVLLACGYTVAEAREGLRFTLGDESHAVIDDAIGRIIAARDQVIRGSSRDRRAP